MKIKTVEKLEKVNPFVVNEFVEDEIVETLLHNKHLDDFEVELKLEELLEKAQCTSWENALMEVIA